MKVVISVIIACTMFTQLYFFDGLPMSFFFLYAFGSVFRGKLDDGTLVAVKSVEGQKLGKQSYAETRGTFFIVYDLYLNESLDNWILPKTNGHNSGCLPWKLRCRVAIEVAQALGYLVLHHDCRQRILRLNIKLENELLDDDFRVVVANFGLAKLISKYKTSEEQMVI
ncbi:hypothetical protein GIB67_034437 [Kingdonia uniflora]|uniref:Protein kinase domain-containing protein n=1 Tax=Kingdonia uniflora TaxID=39325 RepID=A0A7J7PAU4_9MAGN|nr:hypothetical protein GIB67_034437 [Kingdonia uniflora]